MRERIRQLVINARPFAWTQPVEHNLEASCIIRASGECSLGAEAVRLARIAAAMHMDQASKLRARMAAERGLPSLSPAPPVEIAL